MDNKDDDRVNILLVDDQPQRLLSYEAILSSLGQNLIKAQSGTEALQRLMERDFAAILLDVNMPTMNGFDTAMLIHQHPRFEKTPIIFVTAVHVTNMDQLKGYELGAVDYCYVPIVPEVLRGKVQVLVELYAKRRELERANAALAHANELLREEKTRELEDLNQHLVTVNAELARTNEALQREIVERTHFEQRLKEADRRKDEFLAMLSHELRNPLAAISNVVHLLKSGPAADAQTQWVRDVLGRQTGHLTRLIDDLLDISRITRGLVTLRCEVLDLRSVITAAVENTRRIVVNKEHTLVVEMDDEPVHVLGDRVRLTQVVDNVLTNAAKYTPVGGNITVTLAATQGETEMEAIIRVTDTGVGISAEHLPSIFDLFYQADVTLDRAEGGLGIGLALSRGLMEQHGGRIDARSDGVGKGSEFVLRLPLHVTQPTVAQISSPADGVALAPLRMLVVDDGVDMAKSMAIMLELRGHDVRVAHNGNDALHAIREYEPHAVLMDIGMPGINGYDAARQIRADPAMRDVLLIAITGYGQQVDIERSRVAGFDHHFVKPLDFDELHAVLASATLLPQRAEAHLGSV